MKIRVMSDLHVDVNCTTDFGFIKKLNNCDLNIIAGDIAGDHVIEKNFLDTLHTEKPIVCVAGNHLGYNSERFKEQEKTKDFMIKTLQQNFKGPICYLENEYITVQNKIIFGGVMYSNFNLYGNTTLYKSYAERGMNDFVYVKTKDKDSYRTITPDDYVRSFNKFLASLDDTISHTEGDIIVVTHFAPSQKSISEKYNGMWRSLNPAYASNLETFIKDNPRIKLWVHGHMHDTFNYKIGKCKVICYPYGYGWDRNDSPKDYKGKVISIK